VERALKDSARNVGHALGRRALEAVGEGVPGEDLVDAACGVLSSCAYEPLDDGEEVVLLNCPFHALAQDYRVVVCNMNLALMEGLTEELAGARLKARLEPEPGRCCVRLRRR
jgi:predicted ArsR family transcriptional regulator